MFTISPSRSNARNPLRLAIAASVMAALASCAQVPDATGALAPVNQQVQMLDESSVAKLRTSFLEVAGSEQVTFDRGSARLTPKARFRLERQALWLAENESVAIRLRSVTTNAKDVAERRLAMRRSEAVRDYLKEFGVQPGQFIGVDVESGRSESVTTLIDPLHFGAPLLAKR